LRVQPWSMLAQDAKKGNICSVSSFYLPARSVTSAPLSPSQPLLGKPTLVEWFSRFCGRRAILLLWAAGVQTAAAIGVGVARSFWLAVPLFLVVAGTGLVGPVKQAFLHQLIDPAERATIVSFDSMFANAGSVVGEVGLGHLSQVGSIAEGYVVGGAFTIVVLPVLALLRRLRAPADSIVGTGGRQGPCAGLGLPSVASIDARARDLEAAGPRLSSDAGGPARSWRPPPS
jgi:hypothetical protein